MYPLPLVIETRASATARFLLVAAHLAALAALFLALLPLPLRLLGCVALAASLGLIWRRPASSRLRGKGDGQMEIWRAAAWQPLELRADSVVLPWLIVLRWREGRTRRGLALPADALAPDDHRRLRVWLQWNARFPQAPLQ
jgi:toxin CptA